jgi:S1-C subfamily serine protease
MEDLNKSQIILLSILISFVTSIATGIMTTSLLQEAPIEVTRNINRIVEKTIETITPSDPVVSKEKEIVTVVVKEEDLIMETIQKNLKSIVRINETDLNNGTVSFYGMGIIMTKDGQIATARKNISYQYKYTITTESGVTIVLTPVGLDKSTNFIIFKATVPEGSSHDFVPTKLVSS